MLAFDYRRLGESGGQPRQIVRMGEQHADWHAAIQFARSAAGRRPNEGRDLGFLALGRPHLPGRVSQPGSRRSDRANAARRWPGRRARRDAPHDAARVPAPDRPRPARRRRWPRSAASPCWSRSPVSLAPSPCSPRPMPSTATERSTLTTGIRTGSKRSPPARRCASASTGPLALPPASGVPCWCWPMTKMMSRRPAPPPAPASALPAGRSSACAAGTTSPSWTVTNRPSTSSCPSCAGTCSSAREPR